jgi:hypothetical protein
MLSSSASCGIFDCKKQTDSEQSSPLDGLLRLVQVSPSAKFDFPRNYGVLV